MATCDCTPTTYGVCATTPGHTVPSPSVCPLNPPSTSLQDAANVEYFFRKCNTELGTHYTAMDFGSMDNAGKLINLQWLAVATRRVYNNIHQPKACCRLKLSVRFNPVDSKRAATVTLVNSIVTYLKQLNKICDDAEADAVYDRNCNCVCNTAANAIVACNCDCASDGSDCTPTGTFFPPQVPVTKPPINVPCGPVAECQCDCTPYACNCTQPTDCTIIPSRPMTEACPCTPPPPPPPPSNCSGGGGNCSGGGGDCYCACNACGSAFCSSSQSSTCVNCSHNDCSSSSCQSYTCGSTCTC